jgi:adenylate cyclase
MIKKIVLSPWTALITLFLVLAIRIADPSFVESVRLRYFDQLITSKGTTVSKQVHVVNIDDQTIRQKGQFPFPRNEYAKLITDLYSHGAGLVVFNIYMPERDRFGQDAQLAETFKKHAVILPHTAGNISYTSDNILPFRPGVSVIGDGQPGIKYENIEPNIKLFNDTAAGIGIVNTLPEIDGVTRRIPMVIQSKGLLYPSITMETMRVAAGDASFQVKSVDGAIEAVRILKFGKITTDQLGRIWVDWSNKPIEHSADKLPKDFGGGIVIVGLTAKGLNNPVATPIGAVYPHYLQAAVLDTVISGTNISRPDYADGVEIIAILLSGLLLLFLTRYVYVGLGAVVILSVGAVFGSMYAYSSFLWLYDITAVVIAILLVSLHAYGIKFVSEFLQKQQIKKQFGTYLSPAMVEKLQKNPELLTLGGESRELSIMFTDVRGFTTISEHYGKDVQGLTKIMNRYMTAMTEKIIENNGTLDKYIGDAQMAFWNAPLDDANHAKNAVRTALQMMESLNAFNKEIKEEGIPAFGMGLGINTGTVVVGNMGSRQRFDYTCLGDSVNLASRLEGQSKPYGVKMILGERTAELVKDEYDVVELDTIAVKGKTEGVRIFGLASYQPQHYSTHKKYLKCYYDGNWTEAHFFAEHLKLNGPTEMRQYYSNMIERLDEGVPSNWDGTYRATSK